VLQGYRKSRQLTQAQVGARVGLPQKEISKLETNATTNQPDANPLVFAHPRRDACTPAVFTVSKPTKRPTNG